LSLQTLPSQNFELDEDDFEPASEQGMLRFAKIACVLLAVLSLTLGVINFADIRFAGEASNLWRTKIGPAIASVVAATDAEIQRRVFTKAHEPSVAVQVVPELARRAVAVTASYVLPDTSVSLPAPARVVPAPSVEAPANAELAAKRVRTSRLAFASASPNDLLLAPPLERPNAPVSATPKSPAPAESDTQVSMVTPFPSLASVPLPRPSPNREEESHDPTPAELLGLDFNPKERAKSERCLANAVYFESRSEPLRGQIAVAQVVMNRVFSPFYPKDVCAVVYQNANRHLSCQFTFACDGKSKAIHDRGSWARANRIAKQTLDGKLWVPEVAKSTHYHAQYVHPNWVHEMRRMFKTGVHLFYRPYNWGDGSDEQGWVKPTLTATAKR
jgi:spore germination cell wall hydrolase CwlJ-like protein